MKGGGACHRLITDMLTLARSDRPYLIVLTVKKQDGPPAAECLRGFQANGRRKQIALSVELPGAVLPRISVTENAFHRFSGF